MVENGPNGRKWSKMLKNGGPDLKRAQRTGLSARRARRTKSSRPEGPKAGPKGRYLEVGARRAPRLLVIHIIHIKLLESPIPATATATAPSQKAHFDDISGTKRGTIDPLVSKRPEKNSE